MTFGENAVPLMDGMWTIREDKVYLMGSICEDCGEIYFPPKEINICSHCQSESIKTIELSRIGEIHSYTVVHQPPAGGFYKGSVPFIYALVKLPEGVIIPGHVIGDIDNIQIGDYVEVFLDVLFETEEETVISYKFKKCEEAAS